MKTEKIETDVLVVGGGIAGLMAAIRAKELGVRVVVVDKGNTLTSGAGGCGNDHFICYIPEVHGPDIKFFIRELMLGQMGPLCQMLGPSLTETWISKTFEVVKLWDAWGIPMKHDGEWKYSGHAFPGHLRFFLKYKGKYQKKVLTEQARKRGVEIINRSMVIELLGNPSGVAGALAIDAREEKGIEFPAKSVILATGRVTRLYPGISPAVMNNNPMPLNLTGDGRAMAYRLGGELGNLGMLGNHVGLKNLARAGQGSWLGVYRGPDGKPLGHYVSEPSQDYGDILPEVDKKLLGRLFESGKGPVYMDCTGISREHLDFMIEGLVNEGNEAVVNHLKEENIDLTKHPIEFMTYPFTGGTGLIVCNGKTETSVRGLFAIGEESTHGISAGATFGWLSGEQAALHAEKTPSQYIDVDRVQEKKNFVETLQKRRKGFDWKDANTALQEVMKDYAGVVRSEPMLQAGLHHLRRLRHKVDTLLKAENRWELTRCFEVLNLYDLGELIFLSALDRKESRGEHRRVDYPYTDPLLNGKLQVVKCVAGQPALEWKSVSHPIGQQLGI
jgi:succinate dehydrogenase/fumarate reductase flavoprotein subunit